MTGTGTPTCITRTGTTSGSARTGTGAAPAPARREACRKDLGKLNPRGRRKRFCDAKCRSRGRRNRTARLTDPAAQPFPTAVRAAIRSSGLPLRALAAQLEDAGYPLSPSALSQWGTGRVLPRLDDDLRDRLFAVERLTWATTGSLVRARPKSRPGPRSVGRVTAWGVEQCAAPPRHAVRPRHGHRGPEHPAGLGDGGLARWARLAHTEHRVLDHRRLPARTEITITLAAVTGTTGRYWDLYTPAALAPGTVRAGPGCLQGVTLDGLSPIRVEGRTYRLAATELLLDPWSPGTTTPSASLSTTTPAPAPGRVLPSRRTRTSFWTLVVDAAMRELRTSIRFDPATITPIQAAEDGSSAPILLAFPAPGCTATSGNGSPRPDRRQPAPRRTRVAAGGAPRLATDS